MTERVIFRGGETWRRHIDDILATMRERAANPPPPASEPPVTIYIGADGQFQYLDTDAPLLASELTVDVIESRIRDTQRHHGDQHP